MDVDYFTIKYYDKWPFHTGKKKKHVQTTRPLWIGRNRNIPGIPWIPWNPWIAQALIDQVGGQERRVQGSCLSVAVEKFPVDFRWIFPGFLAPKIHHHHPFSWVFFMICSRIALHVPIFYRYFSCIFPCWTDLFPPLSHHQRTKHQPSRLPRGALSALSAARLVTSQTVIHEAHDADAKVHADPGGEYPATVCNGKSRSCWKFPNSRFTAGENIHKMVDFPASYLW